MVSSPLLSAAALASSAAAGTGAPPLVVPPGPAVIGRSFFLRMRPHNSTNPKCGRQGKGQRRVAAEQATSVLQSNTSMQKTNSNHPRALWRPLVRGNSSAGSHLYIRNGC